jgi:hypothetical protein
MRGRCEKFTSTQYGRNPMWKESLILPYLKGLKSKAMHAEERFDGVWEEEEVVITLFDMVPLPQQQQQQRLPRSLFGNTDANVNYERRYLGRAVVPLSAAIHGRVECFLRVETPEINMDYTYQQHHQSNHRIGGVRGGSGRVRSAREARDDINGSGGSGGLGGGDWMSGGMVGAAIGGLFSGGPNQSRGLMKDSDSEDEDEESSEAFLNIPPSDCREKNMKKRATQRMMLRLSLVLDPPPANYTQHNTVADIALRRNDFEADNADNDNDDEVSDTVWGEELDVAGTAKRAETHALFGASKNQHALLSFSKFSKFNHSTLADMQHQVHSYACFWLKNVRKLVSTQDHPLNRIFLCYAKQLDGKEVIVTQYLRSEGICPPKQRHFPPKRDENDKEDFDNSLRTNRRMKRRAQRAKQNRGGGGGADNDDNDNDEEEKKGTEGDDVDDLSKNEIATKSQVCRFVSLLPIIKSTWTMKQLSLWCSCSEFLEMGVGGGAEHATLLWHYLIYIQTKKLAAEAASLSSSLHATSHKKVVKWDYYLLFARNVLGEPSWSVIGLEPIISAGHYADFLDGTRIRRGVIYDPYNGEALNISDHRVNISDIGYL